MKMQKDLNKFIVTEKRQLSTNKKRKNNIINNNFNLSSLTSGTPEKNHIKGILNTLNMST
jgi:hypothetical protein